MKETETKKSVATAKAEPVKETVKEVVKAETVKAAKAAKTAKVVKTAEKKATTTKTKSVAAKKNTVTAEITIQFNNKAYTMDELIQSAKDRWKFDLDQKESELKSLELFVKPEDDRVYCVYNKEIQDSFGI